MRGEDKNPQRCSFNGCLTATVVSLSYASPVNLTGKINPLSYNVASQGDQAWSYDHGCPESVFTRNSLITSPTSI